MGCFFHFCQAIYRQIQHVGLQQQYSIDETFRDLCRKLMALALMPSDKINQGLNDIHALAQCLAGQAMLRLLQYFNDQWMPNMNMWNVCGLDSRTNNVCEGNRSYF